MYISGSSVVIPPLLAYRIPALMLATLTRSCSLCPSYKIWRVMWRTRTETTDMSYTGSDRRKAGPLHWQINCSVLVHQGTGAVGHYWAFIKPGRNKQWYKIEGANVKTCTCGRPDLSERISPSIRKGWYLSNMLKVAFPPENVRLWALAGEKVGNSRANMLLSTAKYTDYCELILFSSFFFSNAVLAMEQVFLA